MSANKDMHTSDFPIPRTDLVAVQEVARDGLSLLVFSGLPILLLEFFCESSGASEGWDFGVMFLGLSSTASATYNKENRVSGYTSIDLRKTWKCQLDPFHTFGGRLFILVLRVMSLVSLFPDKLMTCDETSSSFWLLSCPFAVLISVSAATSPGTISIITSTGSFAVRGCCTRLLVTSGAPPYSELTGLSSNWQDWLSLFASWTTSLLSALSDKCCSLQWCSMLVCSSDIDCCERSFFLKCASK